MTDCTIKVQLIGGSAKKVSFILGRYPLCRVRIFDASYRLFYKTVVHQEDHTRV